MRNMSAAKRQEENGPSLEDKLARTASAVGESLENEAKFGEVFSKLTLRQGGLLEVAWAGIIKDSVERHADSFSLEEKGASEAASGVIGTLHTIRPLREAWMQIDNNQRGEIWRKLYTTIAKGVSETWSEISAPVCTKYENVRMPRTL